MAQTIAFNGKNYPIVSQSKMTPGEIDAVERVTGLSLQKIRRMGDTCVCEHGSKAHQHKDDQGEIDPADTSCTSCDCEAHESDLPMRVSTAFMWISVKRVEPTVKFNDIADTPMEDFAGEDDADEEADPTEPPHAEA